MVYAGKINKTIVAQLQALDCNALGFTVQVGKYQLVQNRRLASNKALDVAVYDLLGKQVLRANAIQSELNISSLNPGMYFVNMTQGSSTSTKKLLVK